MPYWAVLTKTKQNKNKQANKQKKKTQKRDAKDYFTCSEILFSFEINFTCKQSIKYIYIKNEKTIPWSSILSQFNKEMVMKDIT